MHAGGARPFHCQGKMEYMYLLITNDNVNALVLITGSLRREKNVLEIENTLIYSRLGT